MSVKHLLWPAKAQQIQTDTGVMENGGQGEGVNWSVSDTINNLDGGTDVSETLTMAREGSEDSNWSRR